MTEVDKLRETLEKSVKDCEHKNVFSNLNIIVYYWLDYTVKSSQKNICKSVFSYLFFLLATASWQETQEGQLSLKETVPVPCADCFTCTWLWPNRAELITGTTQILCYFVVGNNQSFSKSFKNLTVIKLNLDFLTTKLKLFNHYKRYFAFYYRIPQ